MREDQLVRHWHIIKTLEKSRQGITVRDLADVLECSVRTIFRDLSALQSAGFPISTERRGGETHYQFMEGYKAGTSLEISNDEMVSLYLSSGLLKLMEGTVFQRSLDLLIKKVCALVPQQSLDYFKKLSESIAVGKGASHDYGAKQDIIKEIMKGLTLQQTLAIRYFSASSNEVSDREVDPYKLWYANNAFYLIGWCHTHDMVRTFLVDRIEQAGITPKNFTPSDSFDFSTYHDDAFRVIRDGKKEKYKIRFKPEVAHSFREKKWHPSQQVKIEADGCALVSLEAEGAEEIKSWVLSWGGLAEVLEPKSLRKEIMETADKLRACYG